MTTAERRISQLEKLLKREAAANRQGHNYYKIGFTQFELYQLYKLSGAPSKAREMLNNAFTTVQNPECKKDKKAVNLLHTISFCINNPTAPPIVQLPVVLRYLSPIILLVGYVATYAAYFLRVISYIAFFAAIFVVFIGSVVATSIVNSSYLKQVKKEYVSSHPPDPSYSRTEYAVASKSPDDIMDDARAELSLANMYFSMKDIKETQAHMERARRFLNDPVSDQSKKKGETAGALTKLERAVAQRKLAE